MRLLFVSRDTLSSAFLRAAMWCEFSHVVLVNRFGTVIEATGSGVHLSYANVVLQSSRRHLFADVPCDDRRAWEFAEKQLGKPYDYTALLGIMFRRDWQDDRRWFCSELVASALMAGGTYPLHKATGRVTVQDLLESPVLNWRGEVKLREVK
jgi:uncharacterized protein YycO